MRLNQSYLVVPAVISSEDQARIDRWSADYEKRAKSIKRQYSVEAPRRRLLSDDEWWYNRRFFWVVEGRATTLYQPEGTQGAAKVGVYTVPDFAGKICVGDEIGWEFLNIFVEEMCKVNGLDLAEKADTYDYSGRRFNVSYKDVFNKRVLHPGLPWNPMSVYKGTIDTTRGGDYFKQKQPPVYSWRFLYDLCELAEAVVAPQTDANFVAMLYTIASSRNPDDWKEPSEADHQQVQDRTHNIELFLSFCETEGGPLETYTFRRLLAEYELCAEYLDTSQPLPVVEPQSVVEPQTNIALYITIGLGATVLLLIVTLDR
jgi:hypothetical protein